MTELSDALGALGRVPDLVRQLERVVELQTILGAPVEPQPLPPSVRPNLRELTGLLALSPSAEEMLRLARGLDLRDLSEAEVAYLERITVKTVQKWRTDGTGPAYRNEAGIRYPLRWYWEWREKGRQRLTAQRVRRGNKRG
ncbi:MAG TPA: hypothetical protein VHR45_16065 [Thermoanaerobaculia bacterium]|nr:hypothetical protein [Thermoanaerobaculia bacterium]